MKSPSVFRCFSGSVAKHGCWKSSAWNCAVKFILCVLGVLFVCLTTLAQAQAELLLFIKETNLTTNAVTSLVIAEGDSTYDMDPILDDFIDVDLSLLGSYFASAGNSPRWEFTSFFQASSSLGDNARTDLPAQILNIQFEAKNVSGANDLQLEVLATYVGSNGSINPTFLELSGGGNAGQPVLNFKLLGSYSTDPANLFYTNNYFNENGPTEYVFTEAPAIDASNDWSSDEPTKNLTGSNLYALTHGVVIIGLEDGNTFASQSSLEYVLPEPASIASWFVVTGLVGLSRFRKRRS